MVGIFEKMKKSVINIIRSKEFQKRASEAEDIVLSKISAESDKQVVAMATELLSAMKNNDVHEAFCDLGTFILVKFRVNSRKNQDGETYKVMFWKLSQKERIYINNNPHLSNNPKRFYKEITAINRKSIEKSIETTIV